MNAKNAINKNIIWDGIGEETHPYIINRIRDKLAYVKNKRILDIGCGSGLLSEFLTEKNRVYGIDIVKKNVDDALARGLRASRCDIEKGLSFKSNEFDVILCTEVLEHLQNPDIVIKEIHRILKRKGEVFITVPNFYSLTYRILILKGRHKGIEYPHLLARTHIRNYSIQGLTELLESCELTVKKSRGIGFFPLKEGRLLHFFEGRAKTLCDNMLILAEKEK